MNIKTLIAGCLLIVVASIAGAGHPLFEKVDKNKDGKIDRNELIQYMKENAFERLDVDRDEGITQAEWNMTHNIIEVEEHKEVFKFMDRDRDRRISYPEFSNYTDKYSNIEEAFMILDKNMDGALSPDEISYVPSFRLFTIRF